MAGSTPGSDGQMARAFRNVGADIQAAQGGARLRSDVLKADAPAEAEEPPVERLSRLSLNDDEETKVTGDISQQVRDEARKWAEEEALRRCKIDEARSDEMRALRLQLSSLMDVVAEFLGNDSVT